MSLDTTERRGSGINPADFRRGSLLIIEPSRKSVYRKERGAGERKRLQTKVPPTDSLLYRLDLTDDALNPSLFLWVYSVCNNSGEAVISGLVLTLQSQLVPLGPGV